MKNKRFITRIGFVADESIDYFISLFVTSTFLGYLADALGFNDAAQGIINTIPTLALAAQFFSMLLSGRRVKRLVTLCMVTNQLAFILIYMIPMFDMPPMLKNVMFVAFLVIANLINNAIKPARLVWLMQSVDNDKRGSFTAKKEMISLAGGAVISMSLGTLADTYREADGAPTREFYVICIIALVVLMVMHTVSLLISHEEQPMVEVVPVRAIFKRVVTNRALFKLIPIDVFFHLLIGISTPFFASYLREELGFKMSVITAITIVGVVARIVASPLMGKISDKKSFSFTMILCTVFLGVAFLGACFAAPGAARWIYLVFVIFYGFSTAGINSGLLNLVYDYVAPADRAAALGIKNACGGFVGFLASLGAGAALAKIQEMGGLTVFGHTLYAQQVLAIASTVITPLFILYIVKVIVPMHRVDLDVAVDDL